MASLRGPVILFWDAVERGARHPEQGHNVVYHEFAHILDMRDGTEEYQQKKVAQLQVERQLDEVKSNVVSYPVSFRC